MIEYQGACKLSSLYYLHTLSLFKRETINGYCFLNPFSIFFDVLRVGQVLFDWESPSSLKLSGRPERTWIAQSGNNIFRHRINVSSAVELPVKMRIFSILKLLSSTGLVAFRTARRAQSAAPWSRALMLQ
jgi:hypothetical protein